ncbi:MAG: two pore domain potassium channel family protein [Muribaculaceae bacterium]|nr:two pore domain potassium channel family protein [Muribaculaceae bacterium]
MIDRISNRIRHFFHVVSNVRPIVWMLLYLCFIPIFALIYHWLPDGQFRIPDAGGVDYGSWLYYSIVTITTLGFGDYTPCGAGAQAVTAIEVGFGLAIMGFFLNAVGAMKSEIDIDTEMEKQRRLHTSRELDKLLQSIPMVLHNINAYVQRCEAVGAIANPERRQLLEMLRSGSKTALCIDSLQNRVDLSLWPELLENCFGFVADYQMFSAEDPTAEKESLAPFVDKTKTLALAIEKNLTAIQLQQPAPAAPAPTRPQA